VSTAAAVLNDQRPDWSSAGDDNWDAEASEGDNSNVDGDVDVDSVDDSGGGSNGSWASSQSNWNTGVICNLFSSPEAWSWENQACVGSASAGERVVDDRLASSDDIADVNAFGECGDGLTFEVWCRDAEITASVDSRAQNVVLAIQCSNVDLASAGCASWSRDDASRVGCGGVLGQDGTKERAGCRKGKER